MFFSESFLHSVSTVITGTWKKHLQCPSQIGDTGCIDFFCTPYVKSTSADFFLLHEVTSPPAFGCFSQSVRSLCLGAVKSGGEQDCTVKSLPQIKHSSCDLWFSYDLNFKCSELSWMMTKQWKNNQIFLYMAVSYNENRSFT